jgi:hypothetical protein
VRRNRNADASPPRALLHAQSPTDVYISARMAPQAVRAPDALTRLLTRVRARSAWHRKPLTPSPRPRFAYCARAERGV